MPAFRDLDPANRPPHPIAYTVLIVPFGAMSGYVSVAMAFMCTRFGLSVEDGALLVAAGMFPHVWKFLWAPVVDTTLSRKRWYRLAVVLCAAGVTAMSAIPMNKGNMRLLEVTIFTANLASTLLCMSLEGMMAHATPAHQRGRVSGWFQAGNLGGTGLGGGAGLWMATHFPAPWQAGAVLGAVFLAGSVALRWVPEAAAEFRQVSLPRSILGVVLELWGVIRSRGGIICAALCVLPINTGTATNVLSQAEVAAKWGADENTVALVNGVLNGVLSAAGCLVAGAICARINSRTVYIVVALLMAAVSVSMALSPFTRANYIGWSLLYVFVLGLSYTAFTGFVLDAIGKGAAATKYNAFASLSNAPITYMGLVLAWAQTTWGERGMLYTEAAAGVAGVMVLGVLIGMVSGIARGGAARGRHERAG